VGDIADEYDPGHYVGASAASGPWVVSGGLHGDEVAELAGFDMPDGEYETLAGFVLDRLGRIPEVGDSFVFDGWSVDVLEMDRHRVARVRLTAPRPKATS
jgi:CBS domain containing-hemolysin-like protein